MRLRKLKKWYIFLVGLLNRKNVLNEISRNDNLEIAKISDVCKDLVHGRFSNEERQALEKIKVIRSELCSSDEILRFKKIWEPEDSDQYNEEATIAVKEMARTAAIPINWGEFHFKLLRTYKPEVCLELGTNLGVSALYLASALEINGYGSLVTLEGIDNFAEVAERGIKKLNVTNTTIIKGLFTETLESTLKKFEPINHVFIDGHHQKDPTLAYFNLIKPYLAENSVVIFDDIHWSDGMFEAWSEIIEQEHVQVALDFYKLGVAIFNPNKKKLDDKYRISMYL